MLLRNCIFTIGVCLMIAQLGNCQAFGLADEVEAVHAERSSKGLSTPVSLACLLACPYNISYDDTEQLCTFNGATLTNTLCRYGITRFGCTQDAPVYLPNLTNDVIVEGAGSCKCPSNCSSSYRGVCTPTGCKCAPGYTGPDCLTVTCDSQTCSERGTCIRVSGYDTCKCQAGYGGFDCSASTPVLPGITAAFGASEGPQYTSEDKYGNNNPLFNEAAIATIWLEVKESDLEWMMNAVNAGTKQYLPANFTFYNGNTTIATTVVGLRIKGGASRGFIKKSWKISFDQYDDKQTFYQQKKLLLKATSMTPDFVRERTSRDLIYSMGAATQRMVYTNVFINGAYRGLFVQMDDFDQTFLKSRFGTAKGGLWKCGLKSSQPTLIWQGPDCANYSSVEYHPENAFAEANCSVLVHFIDVLNNSPDDQFEAAIQQVFDVPYYLRTLVVEILTSNWDGGSWDGNNYLLYYDPSSSPPLFKYIRQDLDVSIGCVSAISIVWPNLDVDLRIGDIFKYGTKTFGRILTTRILNTPSFQQLLVSYMQQLMTAYYQLFDEQSPYFQRVELMHASVAPFVQVDYWHRLDMGMNFQAFNSNIQQADVDRPLIFPNGTTYNMHYCYEMVPYAKDRYTSADKQIQMFLSSQLH